MLNFDKQFVRAEGIHVWDDQGNCYLDFLGGYGALNLGHNHPAVMAAIDQIKTLPSLLQASLGMMVSALAYNLACLAPGKLQRSFFGNSGAEAVEGALKLARAATGKSKIIYCERSFHGKTLGALSVTGREKYQHPFVPLLPDCEAVPFGDLTALEQALKMKDVAGFIVEPIQGEGGIIVPAEGYLKGARELCSRYEALLIIDEIQTGFGRTGKLFACEHDGVVPDIMCLAKSLGGGVMPIGAYITTEEIWDQAYGGLERYAFHTSTFGGNSWAAAAGIAALNLTLEEDLPGQAAAKGAHFIKGLQELKEKYPLIAEVRGRGLLIGVEFAKPAKNKLNRLTGGLINKYAEEYFASLVAGELQNKHRIITAYTLNNPNVIRFEPPLTVTYEQLDEVLNALEAIFSGHAGFTGIVFSGARTVISSFLRR